MKAVTTAAAGTLLLLAAACGPRARQYDLQGQILAIDASKREVTIRHEDIAGFMPGMTMPFRVADARLLDGRVVGDLVKATLVVEASNAYLSTLETTGHADVLAAPPESAFTPRDPPLAIGEPAPDQTLIDQDGVRRTLSSWRGGAVALTFIYTRCPYPTFCPLMDRNFAAIQQAVLADPALAGHVHLLSISFDPDFDTPAVLKQHAAARGANPATWSYVTGPRPEIDGFAARFGVSIARGPAPTDLTHTLSTAVLDPNGRLVAVYTGNEWTPDEIVRDLRHATATR